MLPANVCPWWLIQITAVALFRAIVRRAVVPLGEQKALCVSVLPAFPSLLLFYLFVTCWYFSSK
jgi:hypothetical protein